MQMNRSFQKKTYVNRHHSYASEESRSFQDALSGPPRPFRGEAEMRHEISRSLPFPVRGSVSSGHRSRFLRPPPTPSSAGPSGREEVAILREEEEKEDGGRRKVERRSGRRGMGGGRGMGRRGRVGMIRERRG